MPISNNGLPAEFSVGAASCVTGRGALLLPSLSMSAKKQVKKCITYFQISKSVISKLDERFNTTHNVPLHETSALHGEKQRLKQLLYTFSISTTCTGPMCNGILME